MSGLKARLFWLVNGSTATNAALDTYGDALRDLQHKVARIDGDLQALHADTDRRRDELARLRHEVAALHDGVRSAVDDLGDRLGSLSERIV